MSVWDEAGNFANNVIGGGGMNAANAQAGWYNQIPGVYQNYMNPYIQQGNAVSGNYQNVTGQMMNNPTGFMNNIMSQYKASPYYNYQVGEATQGANNAAAANGTLGTGAAGADLASTIQGLASRDQNQWINNVMGAMGGGLSGANNMMNRGFDASQFAANGIADAYTGLGNNAYNYQTARANRDSGIASALGSFMNNGNQAASAMGGGMGGGAGGAGGMSWLTSMF